MKKRLNPSICTGFAAALYFFIVLPVQTYIACTDTPPYSLGDLLWEFSLYFVIAWAVVGAALFALSYIPLAKPTIDAKGRKRKKISLQFHVLALAVVVAAIVESGPLSIGLPELNGDFEGYRSGARACLDIALLVAVLTMPLLCYRWLKRHVALIAVVVSVYSAVSLLDVKRQSTLSAGDKGMIVKELIPREEVVDSVVYAPTNNVIVLILDSVSGHAVRKMLQDNPDMTSHFPGFVGYVNNLGMHCPTGVGIPGLFTGIHFKDVQSLASFGVGPYAKDSFIKPYLDNDIKIFINAGPHTTGYTNYEAERSPDHVAIGGGIRPSDAIIYPLFEMTVCDLLVFRIVPYALKEKLANSILASRQKGSEDVKPDGDGKQHIGNVQMDAVLWPLLATKPINPSLTGALNVHHSIGAHDPIMRMDDSGRLQGLANPTYADYVAHCERAFRPLVSCLDVWRTNGVYDASTIILTSDHGTKTAWPENNLNGIPPGAFPFLMVKPMSAKGSYCESDLATSHAKISPLVKALVSGPLDRDEIEKILYCPDRFYRANVGGTEIVDWALSPDWNVKMTKHDFKEPTRNDIHPLKIGEKYTLDINCNDLPYAEFITVNGKRTSPNGLSVPSGCPVSFSFLTPIKNGCFDIVFDVLLVSKQNKEARLEAFCEGAYGTVESTKPKARRTLKLHGVASDNGGLISIKFCNPLPAYVALCGVSYSISKPQGEDALTFLKSWRVDFTCGMPKQESQNLVCKADKDVSVKHSKWLQSKGLDGFETGGNGFHFAVTIDSKNEADIKILLRAPYRKCANGETLPLYADYASLKINGEELLGTTVSTTHDSPHKLVVHAKEGERLHVEGVLAPHRYSILELPKLLIDGSEWTGANVYNIDAVMKNPEIKDFLR